MTVITNPPLFKPGVPEWVARVIIFMVVLPSLALFGISMSNTAASAGFYGIEPPDVQYSMIIFYSAVASFYGFESRLFRFVNIRDYLVLSTIVALITSYICYATHSLPILFISRFIQGMSSCASTSICISLIFSRLYSERAREVGYSVFYGALLVVSQITTLATAPLTDTLDFNTLYKFSIFMSLPGAILLYLILNNVRVGKRLPLYQLDWVSFILYATAIVLMGYVLVYGQKNYWLEDKYICAAAIASVLMFVVYALRQCSLKRAYLSLRLFRYRNYSVGSLMMFVLYLCRGSLNVTSTYLLTVLGFDQLHLGITLMADVAGIVFGVILSSRLMLMKCPVRLIWMGGFFMFLVFHVWMTMLFSAQAEADAFVIPLLLHGLGAGMLMVPIILFMVSSVPAKLGHDASGVGVFVRFTGFCTSIALINILTDYSKNQHYNRFSNLLGTDNVLLNQQLTSYTNALVSGGLPKDRAAKAADALLSKNIGLQTQVRLSMEYYQWMAVLLLIVLLFISLYPYFKRTLVKASKTAPSAVGI